MRFCFGNSIEDRALRFANEAHSGQTDKGGSAYIEHAIRVADLLGGDRVNSMLIACAYLHDVVEDTGVDIAEIRKVFGYSAAEIIDRLTRRKDESYFDYIERCGKDANARLIKMADLVDNMNLARLPTITSEDARRQKKYADALLKLISMEEEAQNVGISDR